MRSRIAKVNQRTITQVLGDKPVEMGNHASNALPIPCDDLPKVLGIEPRGESSGTDKIAEHDRDLTAFCGIMRSWYGDGRGRYCASASVQPMAAVGAKMCLP
jgi:hypothetical protein